MKLDERLRALLCNVWTPDTEAALLALGEPALERLLDAPAGAFFATEMEWRDFGMYRERAIACFAKANMDGVLGAMKKRKWTDAVIARSGIGDVQDPRLVPLLVSVCSDREPLNRQRAVECLGHQRDALATTTVIRALRDRSSDVRLAAIRALAEIGAPEAIDPLREMADRSRANPLVQDEIKRALRKLRKAGR